MLNTTYSANTDIDPDDIIKFIEDYVELPLGYLVHPSVIRDNTITGKVKFNPLEFSVIIDNILLNSQKFNASNLFITFTKSDDYLTINFSDDGAGVNNQIVDCQKLFDAGYSSSGGTGNGLYTVKKYIDRIGGTVSFNDTYTKGFELNVRLKLWI